MVVNRIAGRVALVIMVGVLVLFVGNNAQAFTELTESNQDMSPVFGFDPSINLIPAVLNTNPTLGPCFTCPNGGDAGGTTAGALTDNMNGIIRLNANANVGQEGRNPALQNQTVPTGGNDASAFTVQVDTPGMDFLSAGTAVPSPQPTTDLDGNPLGAVGEAGMRMEFSNSFTFNPGAGSSSTQTVEQSTFTGQQGDNSVQLVRFIDSMISTVENTGVGDSGVVANIQWSQEIKEGGFALLNNTGDFDYNESGFPLAAAPTGPGQAAGLAPTCIGASGSC